MEQGVMVLGVARESPLAEFLLHAGQVLLLLADLLGEVGVLVLQEIQLSHQLRHLHPVLLPAVLEGRQGDVLPRYEVLHIPGRVYCCFLGGHVVIEVSLLGLGRSLLLLAPHLLFELLVGQQQGTVVGLLFALPVVPVGVLYLDLLDQLLDPQVPALLLPKISSPLGQLVPLLPHLLCQFEELLLLARLGDPVTHGGAVVLSPVDLLETVDFQT